MRRVPYSSREWKDNAGRGVCLSVQVNEQRYSVRSYATASEELRSNRSLQTERRDAALAKLTEAVSIDMGETVELYAG